MKIDFKYEIKSEDKINPQNLADIILINRKIENVKDFLNPKPPLSINLSDFNPKYRQDLIKVFKILKDIKKNDQMIVVYTDYDADGITGGAILWETLHLLGFKVMPYVPDRKNEGYGFSIYGIENVIKQFDPKLIISVDHGITKSKEIAYAKKKNVKIIVTDHHLKSDKTPRADSIFHIPLLSGSGVAYFFAKEIYKQFKSNSKNLTRLEANFSVDYLALSSIGTIADLVPLLGPSRSVVKYGLKSFEKIKRYGIKHILQQAGIEGREITPYEIGFMIAPRINAVGRLEHAIEALRLICTTDENKARLLAQKVGETNTMRQDMVEKSVREARTLLGIHGKSDQIIKDKIIILVSDSWHEGIIGLIASKIAEEFYRPTVVMTKTNGHYKGSARSIPTFHITNFLRSLKKYLVDVGGHAQAAGFTLDSNKSEDFIKIAKKKAGILIKDKDLEKKINTDLKIPISKINLEIVKNLEILAPYGIGNPRPTFYSQGKVTGAKLFGKKNDHLKIFVDELELIAFNKGPMFNSLSRGDLVNIVYNLEIDRWNDRERIRGRLIYLDKVSSVIV